jgi:hypothetical protein
MTTIDLRTVSLSEFHAKLQATACHLAGRPVKIIFEDKNHLVHMIRKTALEKGRVDEKQADEIIGGGLCSLQKNGDVHIRLDLDSSVGRLYEIFLHEVAHALYAGWKISVDAETVAVDQSSVWAVSIARREPKDMKELMSWLEVLRSFDEEKRVFYPIVVGATIFGIRRITNGQEGA